MTATQILEKAVLFDIANNGVATLCLNRPDVHNAFNDDCIARLTDCITKCHGNAAVKLLILRSNGKNFSAGADLNWMKSMAGLNFEENKQDAAGLAGLMEKLYRLDKPVIALAQGKSFGGALGLLACSDIVLATEDASFCLSEVRIGLVPAVISPYVVRAMGERQAKRYAISAETFDAAQAKAFGLVHEICLHERLEKKLTEICQGMLRNGPAAVASAKQLIQQVADRPLDAACIDDTTQLIAKVRVSAEGQEGLGAFLQKRKPHWIDS